MANPYAGNLPDNFKHAILRGILKTNRPRRYVESHCGTATYEPPPYAFNARNRLVPVEELRFIRGREYGASYLGRSLIKTPRSEMSDLLSFPTTYPYRCSPAVAIEVLGTSCEFAFCDTDVEAICSVEQYAKSRGCENVAFRNGCGINFLIEGCYWNRDLSQSIVFIDPFNPELVSDCGKNCYDLLVELLRVNARVVFWHGASDRSNVSWDEFLVECVQRVGELGPDHYMYDLDCHFEASLRVDDYRVYQRHRDYFALNHHGVACFGFNQETFDLVRTIGNAFELIYQDYKFGNEDSGAIRFDIAPMSKRSPMKTKRGRKKATALKL